MELHTIGIDLGNGSRDHQARPESRRQQRRRLGVRIHAISRPRWAGMVSGRHGHALIPKAFQGMAGIMDIGVNTPCSN
jgi:hypothetical protein